MANIKIKSQTERSPIVETKNAAKASDRFRIIDGFKFGFGMYIAFLTGTLILVALTIGMWLIAKTFGLSLF